MLTGFCLLFLAAGAAQAEDSSDAPVATRPSAPALAPGPATPNFDSCAGVYGALGRQQEHFGADSSLLTEWHPNFGRIDFNERLTALARRNSKGITELKNETEADRMEFYAVLIDAETDAEPDTPKLKDLILTADACDLQFGFSPSLGG